MSDQLRDRVALVTGASGGIGRGVSIRLAREGFSILAQGRRRDALRETRRAVREAGGTAEFLEAELQDMNAVTRLAGWATRHGPLDAVIYCAGGGAATPVAPESFARWDEILDVIVRAPMRLAALTLPAVAEAKGAFVFICGMYAKMGVAGRSGYCAARHAMEGFAKSLFEEVREQGVRVTLVHPGFVNTTLVNPERLDPARMIQVDDIAELIATAVVLPRTACVTEMTVRPQKPPYR